MLLLTLLFACGDKRDDADTPSTGDTGSAVDTDGDGVSDGEDCEPENENVHPGHWEIPYNGVDDDCDGVDTTDYDEDGYDAQEVGGEDCNDGNPTINPAAVEVCYNEFDDDCDGTFTESMDCDGDGHDLSYDCWDDPNGEEAPVGATEAGLGPADFHPDAQDAWYDGFDTDCVGNDDYDQDDDGEQRDDDGGTDCDDEDAAVNAEAEEAYDARDNDCDGETDVLSNRTTTASWYGDAYTEETLFGYAFSTVDDLDGDGVRDLLLGVPGTVEYEGRAYVLPWAEGMGSPAADALATVAAGGTEWLGWSTAVVHDSGGSPLLAVGAPATSAVYVFTGAQASGGASLTGGDAVGALSWDYAGWMMTTWRHEGAEFLVANSYSDGTIDVVTGVVGAEVVAAGGNATTTDAYWTWTATYTPLDLWNVGDPDGDGLEDLGIAYVDSFGTRVRVLFGDEIAAGAEPSASLRGLGESVFFGGAVDVDGDGLDDLFVSDATADTTATSAGLVWVVPGSSSAAEGQIDSVALATISGTEENGMTRAARQQGDLDGDGATDLLACQPGDGSTMMQGTCRMVTLAAVAAGGDHSLAESRPRFSSVNYSDQYGWLSVVEDIDADGDDDVLLSGIGDAGTLYGYLHR